MMTESKLTKLLIVFACVLVSMATAQACAISPYYQITSDPNKYAEKSNVIFLGKLSAIEESTPYYLQIVEFEVLEVLKGNLDTKIRIVNKIETNCSIAFGEVNSKYYVFGNLENGQAKIVMTGFPSFVPQKMAQESGMLERLGKTN